VHIVPDADSFITLRFTGGCEPTQTTKEALVKAIEIVPQIKPTIRVNCGGGDFIDWNSHVWAADTTRGDVLTSTEDVILATPTVYDFSLYQTAKAGKELVYTFDLPAGLYNVRLKFAEMWLTRPGSGRWT